MYKKIMYLFTLSCAFVQLNALHVAKSLQERSPLQKFMGDCLSMQHSKNYTAAEVVLREKQFAAIQDLDVHATDDLSCTPLMYGAELGSIKIVRMCIEKKANITAQDAHGHTALMKAAAQGHDKIVELLLVCAEETLDQCDQDNWNALTHALAHHQLTTFKLLLRHGAIMIEKDRLQRTLVAIATERGHTDITDDLLCTMIEEYNAEKLQNYMPSRTTSYRGSPVSEIDDPAVYFSDTDDGW